MALLMGLGLGAWPADRATAEDAPSNLVPGGWARPVRPPEPASPAATPTEESAPNLVPGGWAKPARAPGPPLPEAASAPAARLLPPPRRRIAHPPAAARPAPPSDGRVQF